MRATAGTGARVLGGALSAGRAWIALPLLSILLGVFAAGQPSDDWGLKSAPRGEDGRFSNPSGFVDRANPLVTVPFMFRRAFARFRSSQGLPERVEPDLEALQGPGANPSVTWVGHATLLVRMGGLSFLTDPNWSKRAGPTRFTGAFRHVPPGVEIQDLPPIDFVVISHNHYDHMDMPTLRRLAGDHPDARFLVPLANGEVLRKNGIDRVVELDWGESREVGGATIHCLPARHWSGRGIFDQGKALWSSWAVVTEERRFYFGGDTGEFPGFRTIGEALGPFDLAALPIGAYEPQVMMRPVHLDPEQAVQAALDLSARRALGIHYGTFDLADEPLGEPPERFRAAAEAAGLTEQEVWLLRIGETRRF